MDYQMPDVESIYIKPASIMREMPEHHSSSVLSSRDQDQEEAENWVTFMRRYEEKVEGRKMKQRQRHGSYTQGSVNSVEKTKVI